MTKIRAPTNIKSVYKMQFVDAKLTYGHRKHEIHGHKIHMAEPKIHMTAGYN